MAVLEQTKEPGAPGEPLYLDVVTTLAAAVARGKRASLPLVIGGRYGLSSKDFSPSQAKAVFDELAKPEPKNGFTVGITDDVAYTSLTDDPAFRIDPPEMVQAVFYGLGADGTVSANKNSVKIIAEDAGLHAQGYFVYDSHKAGAQTVSHLRFGPRPIHAPYLIQRAGFVACHQPNFLERIDVLRLAAPGATFLLNSPYGPDEVWDHLPRAMQQRMLALKLRFFVIDASKVALDVGLRGRTNTILQTCFFAISGVLPQEVAIRHIKTAIRKTYGRRGEEVVRRNFQAVDDTLSRLFEVTLPSKATSQFERPPIVPANAPEFVREVTARMMEGLGDTIPVSAMPIDGTFPSGTAAWERRNIAEQVPVWDPELCVQCGQCSFVCPHSVIRAKYYDADRLDGAPDGFKSAPFNAAWLPRRALHAAVLGRGLHWLRALHRGVPSAELGRARHQGDQPARQVTALGSGKAQYRVFSDPANERSRSCGFRQRSRRAVSATLVRVLRRLRWLWRDPVPEASVAVVRRPDDGGQRHGLLVDLRRQPAGHAVVEEQGRPRTGLVQLAVRGQRRIRSRLPPGCR